jgi:hypothetical protein
VHDRAGSLGTGADSSGQQGGVRLAHGKIRALNLGLCRTIEETMRSGRLCFGDGADQRDECRSGTNGERQPEALLTREAGQRVEARGRTQRP